MCSIELLNSRLELLELKVFGNSKINASSITSLPEKIRYIQLKVNGIENELTNLNSTYEMLLEIKPLLHRKQIYLNHAINSINEISMKRLEFTLNTLVE